VGVKNTLPGGIIWLVVLRLSANQARTGLRSRGISGVSASLRDMRLSYAAISFSLMSVLAAACSSNDAAPPGVDADAGRDNVADNGQPVPNPTDSGGDGVDAGANDSGAVTPDGGTPGGPAGLDPRGVGAASSAMKDITLQVASTTDSVPVRAYYPQGATGLLPTVVILHGFQLSPRFYDGYAERLATHGFLVLNVDYPAGFDGDAIRGANDAVGSVDALIASPQQLPVRADIARLAMLGHSRGGKVALLATARDTRVKAAVLLDPVDQQSGNCNKQTQCPLAKDLIGGRSVPLLYLGETLDATARLGQACAPADANFKVLYTASKSPAVALTLAGASHMSFLSSNTGCISCGLCQMPTLAPATVLDIAYGVTTAFLRKELLGEAGMATYVDGPIAKSRYAVNVNFESK
jgi:dienelactone hydrolase